MYSQFVSPVYTTDDRLANQVNMYFLRISIIQAVFCHKIAHLLHNIVRLQQWDILSNVFPKFYILLLLNNAMYLIKWLFSKKVIQISKQIALPLTDKSVRF